MKKILAVIIGLIALSLPSLLVFIYILNPKSQPASEQQVVTTPELVERGRYLAENVVLCSDCHSERDWSYYGGPRMEPTGIGRNCITEDTPAAGMITAEDDSFGVVSMENTSINQLCIPNITPHLEAGIGRWTDGEIIRAMREGINEDGKGMFPIMPYFIFRDIADEDAQAIVAYLRSLAPIDKKRPEKRIELPLSLLMQLWPEPLDGPVPMPDQQDTVVYGEYLAKIGRCQFCHTPRTRFGKGMIEELQYSGGVPFAINELILYSNNLTPDRETGIGSWSRDKFIQYFKKHEQKQKVPSLKNTLMNWNAYAGMTEDDLGAIYEYLMTVPAIDNAKRDRKVRESTF